MVLTYTLIAFFCLLIPTIHQLIFGFLAKDRWSINKVGIRSATMQLAGTAIAYILFMKMEGANPNLAFQTGITFLISVGLVVVIQHLLMTIRQK